MIFKQEEMKIILKILFYPAAGDPVNPV